ncbi:hypothetical protein CcaverHIS002_0200420 [Cutaneotrichosporon cavernicola]|uniref:Major facilitator superfamily (MFS) profile domain-containing protein n=1 Tax=Cutaneotrichosporon cavernicola TaxID=279322 RepID=A0AA48KXV2_9TREE|nr:uncharacterized protein CcaverHIS019_0200460 [Cutaneotrichosporon cavernicola]BEI80882.1 hypothetical protein CcaverHIS002_0200420 [Cutaneotrichosporon cavernicola]BEI88684.1 hypothetical protein CcaverHIS019_0200460 [Cutaneotrichosporon cavernicola]BEI96458.1 hypothetical protein CcaverHIS631_0200470 [Cutaneotrichosporon cavernicola]BEJ04230.1 hypothetical protein CcaverHIS641_0200470 [Cutaneotrichosporon cavernicola]
MSGINEVPKYEEKQDPTHVEQAVRSSSDSVKYDETERKLGVDIDEGFDPDEVKRVTRKVDWRLIPMLVLMYAISLIDRTNLSVARTANNDKFDKELGTGGTNNRYSIITVVFFAPYIVFELPSQFGLRAFGARLWLGSAVFLWGLVMLGMGFAQNWQTLAALRVILGVFESALFPGAAFLISCWYPRKELAFRNVVFYVTSALGSSFAKVIGFGFAHLDGRAGLSGWQWMFILYGIVTILIAILAYIFLVDVPSKAHFLTEREREIVMTRIERDRADSIPDPLTWAKIKQYSCELKSWYFAFAFMSTTTSSYALAYFMPRILTIMGFNNVESMLLGTPTYVYAIIPGVICGGIADRIPKMRGNMIIFNAICIIVGTAMYSQLPAAQRGARFAGLFIATGGGNSNVPLILSWQAVSIRAQSKRAFCSALTVAFGGIGGILGSTLFFQREAKQSYPTGVFTIMGLNAATALGALAMMAWMTMKNKKAKRGEGLIEDAEGFFYQI